MSTAHNPRIVLECYMTKFEEEMSVFRAFPYFFHITQNFP